MNDKGKGDKSDAPENSIIAQAIGWLIVAIVAAPAVLTVAATLGLGYRVFLWAGGLN